MEDEEKKAIQKTTLDLLNDLDAAEVAPFLFQNEALQQHDYEALCLNNDGTPRRKLCQKLLTLLTSPSSTCPFKVFIDALRYNNVYSFLADKLESNLKRIRVNEQENCVGQGRTPIQNSAGGQSEENSDISTENTQPKVFQSVGKVSVLNNNKRIVAELAHTLKRYNHNGDIDKFKQLVERVGRIYNKNKFDGVKDIKERMGLADVKFTALEAESSLKRVHYDITLHEDRLFSDMESIIPYTTNPTVTSMTYLARYGSALSMAESLDNGLAVLQYSKHHAEHIEPCRETGMVYYIEVNILSQKYKQQPNKDLKMEILKTAELAMSHFASDNEVTGLAYRRKLLLKMAFCRLGIGLFGDKIENVDVNEVDNSAAKEYLEYLERPEVWNDMEKRRKMFYWVAKSELYRQRGQYELAIPHATEAAKLAEKYSWTAELPNLRTRLSDLEQEMRIHVTEGNVINEADPLAEYLDEFDADDEESGEIEEESVNNGHLEGYVTLGKPGSAGYSINLANLKVPVQETHDDPELPEMTFLKGLSLVLPEVNSQAHVSLVDKPITHVLHEPTNDQNIIDDLKHPDLICETTVPKYAMVTETHDDFKSVSVNYEGENIVKGEMHDQISELRESTNDNNHIEYLKLGLELSDSGESIRDSCSSVEWSNADEMPELKCHLSELQKRENVSEKRNPEKSDSIKQESESCRTEIMNLADEHTSLAVTPDLQSSQANRSTHTLFRTFVESMACEDAHVYAKRVLNEKESVSGIKGSELSKVREESENHDRGHNLTVANTSIQAFEKEGSDLTKINHLHFSLDHDSLNNDQTFSQSMPTHGSLPNIHVQTNGVKTESVHMNNLIFRTRSMDLTDHRYLFSMNNLQTSSYAEMNICNEFHDSVSKLNLARH